MLKKIIAFTVVWSASALALAADDTKYDGAYECQASAIIGDMAEVCSTLFPEVAPRAKKAYASWLTRNSKAADAAAKTCEAEINRLAASPKTRKKAHYRLKINAEYRTMMKDSLKAETRNVIACNGILLQMETPGGPLDN